MKCLFCDKDLKDPLQLTKKSITYYDCDNHTTRVTFCKVGEEVAATIIAIFDGEYNYRMYNFVDTKKFRLSRNREVMSSDKQELLLKLDHNLDITPENAKQQLSRLLSLVVFS
jgi:hypothetical protein